MSVIRRARSTCVVEEEKAGSKWLQRTLTGVSQALADVIANASDLLQDNNSKLRRKGTLFMHSEAQQAFRHLQNGVERAADGLGQRLQLGAGSLSRQLGANRLQLKFLLTRIERQIRDYQHDKALRETRKQPVDVQIGQQLYTNMPQELRTRLWFALLESPHLAEVLQPVQNWNGAPLTQPPERVTSEELARTRSKRARRFSLTGLDSPFPAIRRTHSNGSFSQMTAGSLLLSAATPDAGAVGSATAAARWEVPAGRLARASSSGRRVSLAMPEGCGDDEDLWGLRAASDATSVPDEWRSCSSACAGRRSLSSNGAPPAAAKRHSLPSGSFLDSDSGLFSASSQLETHTGAALPPMCMPRPPRQAGAPFTSDDGPAGLSCGGPSPPLLSSPPPRSPVCDIPRSPPTMPFTRCASSPAVFPRLCPSGFSAFSAASAVAFSPFDAGSTTAQWRCSSTGGSVDLPTSAELSRTASSALGARAGGGSSGAGLCRSLSGDLRHGSSGGEEMTSPLRSSQMPRAARSSYSGGESLYGSRRNPQTVPEHEAVTAAAAGAASHRGQRPRRSSGLGLGAGWDGKTPEGRVFSSFEEWDVVREASTVASPRVAALDGVEAAQLALDRLILQRAACPDACDAAQLLAKQAVFRAMLQVPARPEEGVPEPYEPKCRFAVMNEVTAGQEEMDESITLDIHRTFPEHPLFGVEEGRQALFRLLKAYSLHDLEVGYCQGMAFAAGVMLMYLPQEPAFRLFCRLMDPEGPNLRSLYLPGLEALKAELGRFEFLLSRLSPMLHAHLQAYGIPAVLYASQWLMTAFAMPFAPSFSARVMDIMLQDNNDHILVRVSLSVMQEMKEELLKLRDFEAIVTHIKVQPLKWTSAVMRKVVDRSLASPVSDADLVSATCHVAAAEAERRAARDATNAVADATRRATREATAAAVAAATASASTAAAGTARMLHTASPCLAIPESPSAAAAAAAATAVPESPTSPSALRRLWPWGGRRDRHSSHAGGDGGGDYDTVREDDGEGSVMDAAEEACDDIDGGDGTGVPLNTFRVEDHGATCGGLPMDMDYEGMDVILELMVVAGDLKERVTFSRVDEVPAVLELLM